MTRWILGLASILLTVGCAGPRLVEDAGLPPPRVVRHRVAQRPSAHAPLASTIGETARAMHEEERGLPAEASLCAT